MDNVEKGNQQSGAEFSPCEQYRYSLWRCWEWQGYANQVMFIGLNPSTADESQNDPTVTRCINYAKAWGYGGMFMMNAYAFRATDPEVMKAQVDPVGPANDEALTYRRTQVGLVVACWGTHCEKERAEEIRDMLGGVIQCFGTNKDGSPKHPLYLPKKLGLQAWEE